MSKMGFLGSAIGGIGAAVFSHGNPYGTALGITAGHAIGTKLGQFGSWAANKIGGWTYNKLHSIYGAKPTPTPAVGYSQGHPEYGSAHGSVYHNAPTYSRNRFKIPQNQYMDQLGSAIYSK